jgi:hypothetical protein
MATDKERKSRLRAAKTSRPARAPSIGYRLQDHHALCPDERRAEAPVSVRHPPDWVALKDLSLRPKDNESCQALSMEFDVAIFQPHGQRVWLPGTRGVIRTISVGCQVGCQLP